MTKPIIIGLFNPYSSNPEHALAPSPERSAGHRLWKMLNQLVVPLSSAPRALQAATEKHFYMEVFDRRNLCLTLNDTRHTRCKELARQMEITQGSTVILLGRDVLAAFTCPERPLKPILIHPQVHGGITWRWLPHPSGRTTKYNDPAMRMLAGMLLADVIQQGDQ